MSVNVATAVLTVLVALPSLQVGDGHLDGKIRAEKKRYSRVSIYWDNWELRIKPNGSGSYSYGGNIIDSCLFPAGAFDFADVASMLERGLVDERDDAHEISVVLRRRGQISVTARHSDQTDFVRSLFEKAMKAKSTPRVEMWWKEKPPGRDKE